MKYTFMPVFCLLFCTFCLYSKDTVKWEDDTPEVKIKASGLFSKKKDPKVRNSKNTPADSIAREIAVDNYRFQWQPQWSFAGLGGAILPFALESGDESVLGIVETLPQKDTSSSSIIVFINLADFAIINYTVMTGKDVRKFCFVPFSQKIVCLVKSPYNKYYPEPKFQLQTIDTHTAEVISSTPMAKEEPVAVCSNGGNVFAAFRDSDRIRVYDIDKLSEYRSFPAVSNPAALKCSRDGKKLLAVGSSEIRFFDIEQQIVPEKKITLPAFFNPDKAVLCSEDASKFLLSVFGGDTYFYNGEKFIKICKRTDSDVAWSAAGKSILVGQPQNSSIASYKPDDLDTPETQFRFQKLRPYTNGKLFKIITLPPGQAGIAVLDKRGALCHFTCKRNRWKKDMIIEQPEPL
ncbi:MAG: hypothetical protein PHV82_01780 [Victivallaceae bacterium]|nr:hypothetical protein [Victivallaceae bacterium]